MIVPGNEGTMFRVSWVFEGEQLDLYHDVGQEARKTARSLVLLGAEDVRIDGRPI